MSESSYRTINSRLVEFARDRAKDWRFVEADPEHQCLQGFGMFPSAVRSHLPARGLFFSGLWDGKKASALGRIAQQQSARIGVVKCDRAGRDLRDAPILRCGVTTTKRPKKACLHQVIRYGEIR
jgi:hypothetical protein